MNWLTRLLRRERLETQLDAELRDHFERLVLDYVRDGLSEADARRRARLEFGGLDQVKELCRDARGTRWFDELTQDVRYGWRGLHRNRSFAIVSVLTLALGVGANTAVFGVIHALLLRPLPVPDPSGLISLQRRVGTQAGGSFSYPQVLELAKQSDMFKVLCGFGSDQVSVGPAGAMEPALVAWVSAGYYDTLGLSPQAGRLLTPADDEPGASPAAVISDAYWTRRFGRNPSVIGESILLEGVPVPIVGVSPAGFAGANVGEAADLTLAIQSRLVVRPDQPFYTGPGARWLRILARPKPDLPRGQLQARAIVVWRQLLEASMPPTATPDERRRRLSEELDVLPGRTGTSLMRAEFSLPAADRHGLRDPGPADCVRQRGEPAARTRCDAAARDRRAPVDRRRPRAHHPAVADRERVDCRRGHGGRPRGRLDREPRTARADVGRPGTGGHGRRSR